MITGWWSRSVDRNSAYLPQLSEITHNGYPKTGPGVTCQLVLSHKYNVPTTYVNVGTISVLIKWKGFRLLNYSFVWKTIFWSGECQGMLCLKSPGLKLKAPQTGTTRTLTWIARIHSHTYIHTVTTTWHSLTHLHPHSYNHMAFTRTLNPHSFNHMAFTHTLNPHSFNHMAFTHTLTSTQLQPCGAKRQLSYYFSVHAGSFRVFAIHCTLTWTTGSLMCILCDDACACVYTRGLGTPTQVSKTFLLGKTHKVFLCSWRHSNLRPLDLESDALPVEPHRHPFLCLKSWMKPGSWWLNG